MRKLAFAFMAITSCLVFLPLSGCGGSSENTVVEAPPLTEDDAALDGMSDEDYSAAMDAEMADSGDE